MSSTQIILCKDAEENVDLIVGFFCRIETLAERKQRFVSEKIHIEDKIEELETENGKLEEDLKTVKDNFMSLERRVERLICRVEGQSPVLSQAEEWMRDEIEGLNSHMQVMHRRLLEVGSNNCILCFLSTPHLNTR